VPSASPEERAAAQKFAGTAVKLDMDGLTRALVDTYGDGYIAGQLVARDGIASILGNTAASVDWDKWKPGNAAAASKLEGEGWGQMLAHADITLDGLEQTTLAGLGSCLADGAARGLGADEIARSMSEYLADPGRALNIATTESARAISVASMEGYNAAGIQQVEWLLSPGACEICEGYAADGPYDLAHAPGLPAHPWCRCSYSPVDPGDGSVVVPSEEAAGPEMPKQFGRFAKGEPMDLETAVDSANPTNDRENCQRAVLAGEMRRRGYDVVAKPGFGGWNTSTATRWVSPTGKAPVRRSAATMSEAEKRFAADPIGARYEAEIRWSGREGGAHIFSAEKLADGIRYYDPQTGSPDVRFYWRNVKEGTKVSMYRVDDAIPKPGVANLLSKA